MIMYSHHLHIQHAAQSSVSAALASDPTDARPTRLATRRQIMTKISLRIVQASCGRCTSGQGQSRQVAGGAGTVDPTPQWRCREAKVEPVSTGEVQDQSQQVRPGLRHIEEGRCGPTHTCAGLWCVVHGRLSHSRAKCWPGLSPRWSVVDPTSHVAVAPRAARAPLEPNARTLGRRTVLSSSTTGTQRCCLRIM
jgi:hypothetical protein